MARTHTKMKSADLSTNTLNRLKCAGWGPSRKIDIRKYVSAFASEKVAMVAPAKTFLRTFGGLLVNYTTRANDDDVLDFSADEAVEGHGAGALHRYELILGTGSLSPIGYFDTGSCLLLMDSSGIVYGASGWRLILVGKTGVGAIESIVSGGEFEVLNEKAPSATSTQKKRVAAG